MAAKRITSPVGTGVFVWLTKTNDKYAPTYSVNLRLPDAEAKLLIDEIEKEVVPEIEAKILEKKLNPKTVIQAPKPYGPSRNRDNTVIAGFMDFKIRNAKICGKPPKQFEFKPQLFDRFSKPLPENTIIGSGSEMKVAFRPYAWYEQSKLGFSLRLIGAQIKKIVVKDQGPDALGFTPDEEETKETATFGEEIKKINPKAEISNSKIDEQSAKIQELIGESDLGAGEKL